MQLNLHNTFLFYKIHQGPPNIPCLILNGTASVLEDFDQMAQEIAKDRSVCIFDYRGMGRSGPAAEDVTFLQTATDAFQLLEELGWKRFYLVGHSFGGLVALELMLLLRGRDDFSCCGLVLLSTSAKILTYGTLCSLIYDQLRTNSIGVNGRSYHDMDRNSRIALSQGIIKACAPGFIRPHFDRNIQIIEQQIYMHDALELVQMLHLISEIPVLSITGLNDTVSDQNYFQRTFFE
jgi:pimeloyl-ACP methyl ester carboxylesterase